MSKITFANKTGTASGLASKCDAQNLNEIKASVNTLYGKDLEIWGDSLANGMGTLIATITGRTCLEHSFGGKTSSYIRDQFLANADTSRAQIFYLGRNNVSATEIVINDLKTMISHLGHDNYVILTIPNGGGAGELNGEAYYYLFPRFEQRINEIWPDNHISSRKAIISGWPCGNVKLNASFVQPAVNANVQINVTDTAYLTTENPNDKVSRASWSNKIRIGDRYSADLYEVVSTQSPTLMTVKLLTATRWTSGQTVNNTIYPDSEIGYMQVFQELDWQFIAGDGLPSTFRGDNIHPTVPGRQYVANIIGRYFNRKLV